MYKRQPSPGPHRAPIGFAADPGGLPLYKNGTLVGAVTMRNLLRHRIGAAMALGDEIEAAADEVDLGLAWSKVPAVARSLQEQEVRVEFISSVISSEIRTLTKRAAVMGEALASW